MLGYCPVNVSIKSDEDPRPPAASGRTASALDPSEMDQPTHVPSTKEPCTCGYLEGSAADANTPVRFDPDLNEYHIVYPVPGCGQGTLMLYYCPMCGGAAPPSRRGDLFAEVPPAEADRLRALTCQVKTVDDVPVVLGVPDVDEPVQLGGIVWPSTRDSKPEPPARILNFTSLSEAATVQVALYADGSAHATFLPKYLGPRRGGV